MYLKAIELHGFKSFPEKTKIEFEKGMSVVVGPNGSGKSNISDAIRWVLGETRSSQLRGSGKMEDIIFGGTQKRNPMGFASVSLILDNTGRIFDVDSDEVAVMRKYYRGGDSEYYINGARVRLRDIQELFMDTGLGKNGYSIVGQGKINEIVTAKPEGRREIFEEASGIAKFRYKKNEAEKKLASAEGNITRLTDILMDLEQRVGPLEKESIKARDFINLSSRKKELEITLWLDTVEKSKDRLRAQNRHLEIFNSDLDRVDESLDKSEKYLEERLFYSNNLVAKSDENVKEIRRADREISELNSRVAVFESEKVFTGKQIENLKKELEGFENRGARETDLITAAKGKIRAINEEIDENLNKQSALQIKLDDLAKKARRSGDEKGRLAGEINSLNLRLQEEKIDLAGLESGTRTFRENLSLAEENLEKSREYAAQSKKQADDVKEFIDITSDNITKNNNIRNGLLMKKNSAEEKLEKANNLLQQNNYRQTKTSDRIRYLTEMENSMENFRGSVKSVLNRAKNGGLGGVHGSVAQLINVEKGYETAVETAMGYRLQNIVVENETAAKQGIEFLKSTNGGRATFLPLDTVRPSVFNERLPDWARTGDSIISADPRYNNIISNLMGRTIIVDNINSAASLARKLNYRYKIVTMDGQVLNAGGSFTGGSAAKTTGVFTRKAELENLKKKLADYKEEFVTLDKSRRAARQQLDNINSTIRGADGEIAAMTAEKTEAEIEYARLYRMQTQYERAVENLTSDTDNYRALIKSNLDKKQSLEIKITDDEKSLAKLNSILRSMGLRDEESVKAQSEITEEIQAVKLNVVELKGVLQREEIHLSQLENSLADRHTRREKVLADIADFEAENSKRDEDIKLLKAQAEGLKLSIEEKEKENSEIVVTRQEIELERTTITGDNKALYEEKNRLSGEIAKIEERIKAMETENDSIIAKLWEEYELTVQTASRFRVEITEEAAMKRELNGVKNAIKRLGNVNVGAIEEYKEVSERYKYMKAQLTDLQESKNQLVKLITSLNGEMKTMFTDSFTAINSHFGRIFAELFGGGSARLELTDKEDVLSSGIEIVVSPPGKVIKSLTALSGGEQALVAISIYFAILAHNPSPFCVLDEIEAALDDVNVSRYANYLHRICDKTQFIVITHRRGTMDAADILYGVTMQEDGISKLLKLDVENLSTAILN